MITADFDYKYLYASKLVLETFGGNVIPFKTLESLISDVEEELATNQSLVEYEKIILLNRIWFLKTSKVLLQYPDPDEELSSLYDDFAENFGLLADFVKSNVENNKREEYLAHAHGIRDAYKAMEKEEEGNLKMLLTYFESEALHLIEKYQLYIN